MRGHVEVGSLVPLTRFQGDVCPNKEANQLDALGLMMVIVM